VDNATVNGNDMEEVANSFIMEPKEEEETSQVDASENEDEYEAEEETIEASVDDTEEGDYAEDSEDDETTADDDRVQANLIPVKINGKTEMWKLDDLKRSAAGQGYIQERMREVASVKKEAESVYQALQSERQQLASFANQIQSGQLPLQAPVAPSRELLSSDPIGYMEARAEYEENVGRFQQTVAQMQHLQMQQTELNSRAHQARLQEQMQQLVQVIPEFADKKTGTQLRDQIIKTAKDVYGLEDEALMQVSDARHVRILHDAMRYRQMIGARDGVKQKVQKARPAIKPGAKVSERAGKVKQVERTTSQMKRTGSVDDVAKYLLTR
jgi:hypothetical protein